MDNEEFFDTLYQQWSLTTGAKDTYWMPELEQYEQYEWQIVAVDATTEEKRYLGAVRTEADADFLCGIHGAIPDLIRLLGESTDRADRLDIARDEAEQKYAAALLENLELRSQLHDLEIKLAEKEDSAWADLP